MTSYLRELRPNAPAPSVPRRQLQASRGRTDAPAKMGVAHLNLYYERLPSVCSAINLHLPRKPGDGAHRPVRLRQVHAAEDA